MRTHFCILTENTTATLNKNARRYLYQIHGGHSERSTWKSIDFKLKKLVLYNHWWGWDWDQAKSSSPMSGMWGGRPRSWRNSFFLHSTFSFSSMSRRWASRISSMLTFRKLLFSSFIGSWLKQKKINLWEFSNFGYSEKILNILRKKIKWFWTSCLVVKYSLCEYSCK